VELEGRVESRKREVRRDKRQKLEEYHHGGGWTGDGWRWRGERWREVRCVVLQNELTQQRAKRRRWKRASSSQTKAKSLVHLEEREKIVCVLSCLGNTGVK
jgi:hypothetical protein